MYTDVFKLRDLPFRLSPDPQFLYLSKAHARAKAYMESTIWFTDGFVIITGDIGSGKTTLIETFLSELASDVVVAQVNQTQVTPNEFLQTVLVQFGFSPFKMKKSELLATLNQFLIEQFAANRKVLLIVDEAQNLSKKVLEEIRLLSGVETTKEKVLRIILAGQPELSQLLEARDLTQLVQRVRLRFHLSALAAEDLRAYVLHRLEVAGSQGREIFQNDCFKEIYRFTGGVPRLINSLCDTAMMAAFNNDRDTVRLEDIAAAVEELQWVEYAAHTGSVRTLALAHANAVAAAPAGAPASTPAAPVDETLARLIVSTGGSSVAEHVLRNGRLLIGRTSNNDVQIDSRLISRHHCQVLTTPVGSILEDLNSTNGVFVKSKRIRRHHLNDGDVVTLGHHELIYVDERLPRKPSIDLEHTSDHAATVASDSAK